MNNYRLLTVVWIVLLLPLSAEAMAWHGLVPLHSNRKDVERELGKPLRSNGRWMIYEFENEDVSISLSTGVDCPGGEGKTDATIIYIEVDPRKPQRLADLGFDENMIREYGPTETGLIGFSGYVDKEQGLAIRTSEKNVDIIYFLGTGEERLSCPAYYPNPNVLVDIPFCGLCPMLSVSSPSEITEGSVLQISANVGAHSRPTTINWSVNAGKILEGQGTSSITVDTKGLAGQVITGTITVAGFDQACGNTAWISTEITKRKGNQ